MQCGRLVNALGEKNEFVTQNALQEGACDPECIAEDMTPRSK